MKKNLLISMLIIQFQFISYAQDPELPTGKTTIRLSHEDEIKESRLWRIHGHLLEYEKGGSLHDVAIDSIERIESAEALYAFDSSMQLNKIEDDLIITSKNDSVKCVISKVNERSSSIHFLDRKSNTQRMIGFGAVKSYWWKGINYEFTSPAFLSQVNTDAGKIQVKQKKKMTFGKVLLGILMLNMVISSLVAATDN